MKGKSILKYWILLVILVSFMISNSCTSGDEHAEYVAQNLLHYENIKNSHKPGVESFDSLKKEHVYHVFYDSNMKREMEHIYFDEEFGLKQYDFHYMIKDHESLLFSYNYIKGECLGATFFIYGQDLKEWNILSNSTTLYLVAVRPPNFNFKLKLFNYNSHGIGNYFLKSNVKRNNNLIKLDKRDFSSKDSFCLISELTPVDLNVGRQVIVDTLKFIFGKNDKIYLAPHLRRTLR